MIESFSGKESSKETIDVQLERAMSVMKSAAREAGARVLTMQPETRRLAARKDFLTDADLRSERIILEALSGQYPNIPAFSEEKGGEERLEGYVWVIDPIDGTINFFQGDDNWAISIALVKDEETVAGVIYMPAKDLLFSAYAGRDATVESNDDNTRSLLAVNDEQKLSDSQIWLEWGKNDPEGKEHERVYQLIENLDRTSMYPQMRNSGSADAMAVARGQISGFVFLKPDPFDVAAAGLIIKQAGGTVTDVDGTPWKAFSTSFVASNGMVHDELLRVVRSGM